MGALTSTSVVPAVVGEYFSRALLMRALPMLVFARVAQNKPLKERSGSTITFRRIESLPVATTPLVEGAPPSGRQLSNTDISATIQQWGDYVTLTDLAQATIEHPILKNAQEVLSEQAAQTMDVLHRDEAAAGTSVMYGGAVGSRSLLAGVAHKIDASILDRAVRLLHRNNARHFVELQEATVKVSTFGIRPAYIGITHPDVVFTLETLPGWISVEEYSSQGKVMEAEVGAYKNIRVCSTTHGKVYLGGGTTAVGDVRSTSSNADVYVTNIFAKDALATVPLDGMSLRNIIKPLGDGGSADPLDQKATSGWKRIGTQKILNDNFMTRLETTAGLNEP